MKNNELGVLVCGGAPDESYVRATKCSFMRALNSSRRIRLNDPNPKWVMETMPLSRAMGDMVLPSDGNMLIINGVGSGTAGWNLVVSQLCHPSSTDPITRLGRDSRFKIQVPYPKFITQV